MELGADQLWDALGVLKLVDTARKPKITIVGKVLPLLLKQKRPSIEINSSEVSPFHQIRILCSGLQARASELHLVGPLHAL